MKKIILRGAGLAAVGLGFAGAFLPVLPTTPFLLLAAWCFARSSPQLQRWLHENRFFGSYLRNYEAGQGIPRRAKVYTLLLLWAGIGSTVLFFAEAWWLRALLLAIATAVSIHILRMGRPRRKRIVVLIPTVVEAGPFLAMRPADVEVVISGIGTTQTVLALDSLPDKIDWVILAGIAGSYDEGLKFGESVLVAEEREGSFSGGCPWLPENNFGFAAVASNTVHTTAAPFIKSDGAAIENMEGSAFFSACIARNIRFLELRTVSNRVGEPSETWDIPAAAQKLAEDLNRLIDALNA